MSGFEVNEKEQVYQHFEHHDYLELLGEENGCRAGCRTGLLVYRQTEFIQGGVHEDQEGFYVLEGRGRAKVGEEVFSLEPGTSFIAPAGMEHYICRDADCPYIKLFFFHAFSD